MSGVHISHIARRICTIPRPSTPPLRRKPRQPSKGVSVFALEDQSRARRSKLDYAAFLTFILTRIPALESMFTSASRLNKGTSASTPP